MTNHSHRHTYTPSLRGLRMAATIGEQHRITEYEFDRGINALLAKAWEQGQDAGYDNHLSEVWGSADYSKNPYE